VRATMSATRPPSAAGACAVKPCCGAAEPLANGLGPWRVVADRRPATVSGGPEPRATPGPSFGPVPRNLPARLWIIAAGGGRRARGARAAAAGGAPAAVGASELR
jgi:hypothetical protein